MSYCHQADMKRAVKGDPHLICVAGATKVLTWSPELCMSIVTEYHKRHMRALPITFRVRTVIHRALEQRQRQLVIFVCRN